MSVFGHLALKFGSYPENLATEALGYVLGQSGHARRGFVASIAAAEPATARDLRFETQLAGEELARPDLAGLDDDGVPRVLVEAKFWAGFTEHQPVHYLDMLPPVGALVIICPTQRLTYVWRELLTRLQTARRELEQKAAPGEFGQAVVARKHLVLQSWKRSLAAIRRELAGGTAFHGVARRVRLQAAVARSSCQTHPSVYR
jgi:hypothetical protein